MRKEYWIGIIIIVAITAPAITWALKPAPVPHEIETIIPITNESPDEIRGLMVDLKAPGGKIEGVTYSSNGGVVMVGQEPAFKVNDDNDSLDAAFNVATIDSPSAGSGELAVSISVAKPSDVKFNVSQVSEFRGATELLILGTNDFEGVVRPSWPEFELGGFPYMASYFKAIEKANPGRVLILDAGDTIGAAPLFSGVFKGSSVTDIYNAAGYDAMAIGNHEFDWGKDVLDNRIKEAKFPILSANIYDNETGGRPYPATAMLEVAGLKVGVIGLITPDTSNITVPKFVKGLKFTNGVKEIRELSAKLEEEGADVVLLSAHYGDEKTVDKLKKGLKPSMVDAMVIGHAGPKRVRWSYNILSVKADEKSRGFSRITLDVFKGVVMDRAAELVPVEHGVMYERAKMVPDPEIEALVSSYEEKVKEIASEVIGESLESIERDYWSLSEMGDMVTDATVWYSREVLKNPADFAVQNPGGLRADIKAGTITYGDAYKALPFPNYYVVAKMTGKEVKQLLEDGMDDYGHIQVSGLDFKVDWSKAYGERISDVKINKTGEPIDPEATYRVMANNFIAAGGDKYTILTKVPQTPYFGIAYRDPLVEWIKKHTPVTPEIEETIIVTGEHP